MKSCDAIQETFSKFTSRLVYSPSLRTLDPSAIHTRYPGIIDLHAGNLASALLSQNPEGIRERLNKKLRSFADGEIPHAADAFSALFGILARYRAPDTPPDVDNPSPGAESECTWVLGANANIPPHKKSMNIALIRSIHYGSFLDVEYRVREKRVGVYRLAPIHLSSFILRDIRSKLDARGSRLIPTRSVLTRALQWFKRTPIMGRERMKWILTAIAKRNLQPAPRTCKLVVQRRRVTFRAINSCRAQSRRECEQPRVGKRSVLIGNFTSWKSLFIYLCFNEVTFSPLKSQGASSSSSIGTKSTGGTLACSPKSLYHLAQLVGYSPSMHLLTSPQTSGCSLG